MVDVNAAFSPLPQKLHPTSALCVHQQWWPMFETYLDLVSNLTESHNCQSFDRWVWSSAAKRATLIAITHHEHRLPHQIWWRRRDRKRTPVSVLSLPGLCLFYPLSDRLVVSIWPEWLSIPINHGTPLHQIISSSTLLPSKSDHNALFSSSSASLSSLGQSRPTAGKA